MKDYYSILGVARTGTAEEIKKAYYTLAKQYHPDKNDSPEAEEKFKEILEAYDCLKSEDQRRIYDLKRETEEYKAKNTEKQKRAEASMPSKPANLFNEFKEKPQSKQKFTFMKADCAPDANKPAKPKAAAKHGQRSKKTKSNTDEEWTSEKKDSPKPSPWPSFHFEFNLGDDLFNIFNGSFTRFSTPRSFGESFDFDTDFFPSFQRTPSSLNPSPQTSKYWTKSHDADSFDTDGEDVGPSKFACPFCLNRYTADALRQHTPVCAQLTETHRVMPPKRNTGTYSYYDSSNWNTSPDDWRDMNANLRSADWRTQHEAFIDAVRNARKWTGNSRPTSTSKPSANSEHPDTIECKVCNATFVLHPPFSTKLCPDCRSNKCQRSPFESPKPPFSTDSKSNADSSSSTNTWRRRYSETDANRRRFRKPPFRVPSMDDTNPRTTNASRKGSSENWKNEEQQKGKRKSRIDLESQNNTQAAPITQRAHSTGFSEPEVTSSTSEIIKNSLSSKDIIQESTEEKRDKPCGAKVNRGEKSKRASKKGTRDRSPAGGNDNSTGENPRTGVNQCPVPMTNSTKAESHTGERAEKDRRSQFEDNQELCDSTDSSCCSSCTGKADGEDDSASDIENDQGQTQSLSTDTPSKRLKYCYNFATTKKKQKYKISSTESKIPVRIRTIGPINIADTKSLGRPNNKGEARRTSEGTPSPEKGRADKPAGTPHGAHTGSDGGRQTRGRQATSSQDRGGSGDASNQSRSVPGTAKYRGANTKTQGSPGDSGRGERKPSFGEGCSACRIKFGPSKARFYCSCGLKKNLYR